MPACGDASAAAIRTRPALRDLRWSRIVRRDSMVDSERYAWTAARGDGILPILWRVCLLWAASGVRCWSPSAQILAGGEAETVCVGGGDVGKRLHVPGQR